MSLCKVVWGCCADGFRDVTKPMTYEECVKYIEANWDEDMEPSAETWFDPHYTPSLDIINVETGRLMSWVIK